ncbi:restriction endonuclease [Streptomyces sp. NPDC002722]|uniref:restriction endonuclease n=1 Tax=unclassified Streptomyces TaxID=2593676 RepID=UPI0033215C20
MSDTHAVLYDPHGLIEAELPLDRAPYEALVTAVLAWKNPHLNPRDYEQIALQLTGHARAVAADVCRHAAVLPKSGGRGALAEVVLREADGRLSAPLERTARCVQNRARLVRALYTRLDRLTEPVQAAP